MWVSLTWQFTLVSPRARQFYNADLSQGSVATFAGSGGVFNDDAIANLPASLPVKEYCENRLALGELSHWQKYSGAFFWKRCSISL